MRRVLILVVLAILANVASANETIILKQGTAPLEVSDYTAWYQSDKYGDGSIVHRMTVRNTSGRDVVAYGIGIYVFDTFKRDMGRPFIGYDMDGVKLGQSTQPGWEHKPGSAYLFKRYGTAIAYINLVRFRDGEIWHADMSAISRAISDFEFQISDENSSD